MVHVGEWSATLGLVLSASTQVLLLTPRPLGLGAACLNGGDLGPGFPAVLTRSPAARLRHSAVVMGKEALWRAR